MMNTPQGGPYQIAKWPQKVAADGLAGPDQAKLVRAGKDGKPITDGVFPESKEFRA